MKAKKWLSIITLFVSIVSLFVAFIIGKCSDLIYYDISMALLGSAVLGFTMSIIEYFVERRKAMEDFWLQATSVLKELRKIKYFYADAPLDLIVDAFSEERSNEWSQLLAISSEDGDLSHKAKDRLISWYEENTPPFVETSYTKNELEQFYDAKAKKYRQKFIQCMDSYRIASSVELGALKNAYGNLDFIFANKCIRNDMCFSILNNIEKAVAQFKNDSYHFNLLREGEGSFPACASIISELNKKYFSAQQKTVHGYPSKIVFQPIFDAIDASIEEFRCKIYRIKYVKPKEAPVFGKIECSEKVQ